MLEQTNITYPSKIQDLSFYILGNEENQIESVINISNKEITKNDKPFPNGIYDGHMGTTDYAWNCYTCGNQKTICPGHFGSCELKYPVKSPMFKDELLKWLKIICHQCGNVVVETKKNIKPLRRLMEFMRLTKQAKKCTHCGAPYIHVVKDKKRNLVFYKQIDDGKFIRREELFNHEIEKILSRITDETVMSMAKPLRSHPKKFIIRTIRVPPNTIRPDIRRLGSTRNANSDTTNILKTIIEINENLPDEIPEASQISQDLKDMYLNLDMAYHTMLRGGGSTEGVRMITNMGKPPTAIAEHFPKKTGRIRQHLMGKRVEYMIRSVITGDSRLKIHEVGIPRNCARNLEIPETVSERNIERLSIYYTNGIHKYPGCKRIIRKDTLRSYKIGFLSADYKLQIGDVVYRDMITGDYVAFNRQPSLLFSSIAGMRVVVMQTGDTLRINPSICNYYNADFDGDQMNSIVCQNIEARNECSTISKVSRWFISPQTQAPLCGAFMDALIGLSELTKDEVYFDKQHAMEMFADIEPKHIKSLNFNQKRFKSHELVSRLFPIINMINREPTMYKAEYAKFLKYNPADIKINIIRGEISSGVLDKATMGQNITNSAFHIIASEYGADYALECIYNFQQIVHKFLLYHGFTTGISDINISEDAMREVQRRTMAMIVKARQITERLNNGKLIAPIGISLNDFYESEQMNALTAGDDFVHPILADIDFMSNSIARLIWSGSKGQIGNFISLNCALGVQHLDGKRFGAQCGWGRTSPYFVRYDTEPNSKGFVSTSYREGITPDVYAFVAGEGRNGAINNALKTSVTGYQNRIAVKSLEGILIDNTHKSSKGMNLIQTLYAECGIDPAKMIKIKFPSVNISEKDFISQYQCTVDILDKKYHNKNIKTLLDAEFKQLTADRVEFRNTLFRLEMDNPKEYRYDNTKYMPVNVGLVIDNIVYNNESITANLDKKELILDPEYATQSVKNLCANLGYVFFNQNYQDKKRKIPLFIQTTTKFLAILVRSQLCMVNLIKKKINNYLLDLIINKIYITYKKSLIDPGTAVGIIAAQSISESLTQFVLNSKHRVGVQGSAKTSEIDRIKEIQGAKDIDAMKSTHMLIPVNSKIEDDRMKVQEIADNIEMMQFERFISSTMIFFEEYGNPVHPDFKHEAEIIKRIEKLNARKIPHLSKWCIRFLIDKESLIIKSIKLETIIISIKKQFPELYIIYTPENADIVWIRCYVLMNMFKSVSNYYTDVVLPITLKMKRATVRGVEDITSTEIIKIMKTYISPEGEIKIRDTWGIYTQGTNISGVLHVPYVDHNRIQTDSIIDTERMYGIVASRCKIIDEFLATLQKDLRLHCTIFADEMCYSGQVTSIQRTGLQKRESANVTLQISFQNQIQVLTNASVNGLTDRISGISGSLILGTSPTVGTSYNNIIVNEQFIKEESKRIGEQLDDL